MTAADPAQPRRHAPVAVPAAAEPGGAPVTDFTDPAARVVVLAKPGCHLCDMALDVVADVCAQAGEGYSVRSTLDRVEWEMAYWELIPVVFVDGVRRAHWRVDPAALRAALDAPAP